MNHNHYDQAAWLRYAAGDVTERERQAYEDHLYECEACMSIYIGLLDDESFGDVVLAGTPLTEQPVPVLDSAVTDRIMAAIYAREGAEKQVSAVTVPAEADERLARAPAAHKEAVRRTRVPLFRRPVFHYAVAAVITLILMSAGVFRNVSLHVGQTEMRAAEERKPISEQLMEKTVSMLEAFENKQRGGNRRE